VISAIKITSPNSLLLLIVNSYILEFGNEFGEKRKEIVLLSFDVLRSSLVQSSTEIEKKGKALMKSLMETRREIIEGHEERNRRLLHHLQIP